MRGEGGPGEEKGGSRRPELHPGYSLRDHLLDLWLHVSVHRFSCRGGSVMRTSVWELPGSGSPWYCLLPTSPWGLSRDEISHRFL